MFKAMKELFTSGNKDLRHRIYFTLACLTVFILGISIRVPGTDNLTKNLGLRESSFTYLISSSEALNNIYDISPCLIEEFILDKNKSLTLKVQRLDILVWSETHDIVCFLW